MRIRLRLQRRPGKGHANLVELWLRWGRLAAFRESRRTRPGLGFWARALDAASYSIALGCAQLWHRVRIILRFAGAVVSTTTKHDIFLLTSGLRARRRGPVHVFNPQGIGGVPSTFR